MFQGILIIHVLLAIAMVVLILLQHGKGADAGAAFGSGASQSVFGSQGSGSFLSRSTGVLATLFFITSLTLAYLTTNRTEQSSVLDRLETAPEIPVLQESLDSDLPADIPDIPVQ
jgi:preprotein translocase subunit SecG